MGEVGRVGKNCSEGKAPDDVHLLLDKIALIRRPHRHARRQPLGRQLLHDRELGHRQAADQRRERRSCDGGRPALAAARSAELGMHTHLHTIRSYEKLTSEGMNFLGSDLLRLIDEALPGRFGGAPTDYQFVEREDERGLPRVDLRISPRIALGRRGGRARPRAELAQRRREPAATATAGATRAPWRSCAASRSRPAPAKVLALHSLRKRSSDRTDESRQPAWTGRRCDQNPSSAGGSETPSARRIPWSTTSARPAPLRRLVSQVVRASRRR